MKIVLKLFFCAVTFADISLMSMQLDPELIQQVQKITDSHFSDMTRYEGDKKDVFHDFAQDVSTLMESHPTYQDTIMGEPMCQHIVDSLTNRLIEKGYVAHNYCVAKKLAEHLQQYNAICAGIDNAFDLEGTAIQNPWYANATKDMPVRYFVANKDHGQNGGIMTPLSFAIKAVNYSKCMLLLLCGADVNKKYPDTQGGMMTPLYEVISLKEDRQGWQEDDVYDKMILLLLGRNANINRGYSYKSRRQSTPLCKAIRHKDKTSVLALWLYGARLSKNESIFVSEENLEWFNSLGLLQKSADEK